jgi:multiple sugar transport system substrate-binding protein
MTGPLRGLTWDHPRGYRGLVEVALSGGTPSVVWERQALEGFEAGPSEDQARQYDLVVVDHPAVGAAASEGWLVPMEELFSDEELSMWAGESVGQSFESYSFAGHQWALPIDAAAQVGAWEAHALQGEESRAGGAPKTWAEVAALAQRVPMALCLGGPHALLMLAAISLSAGGAVMAGSGRFVEREVGEAAFGLMRQLLNLADPVISWYNPIGVLDALAARRAAYCPLVYGYVTYQSAGRDQLRAVDAPSWEPGGRRGSVLGGAGVAVSSWCRRLGAARSELRRLMAPAAQVEAYAAVGGQACLVRAWEDARVDRLVKGFYRATRATVDQAWVRPRWPGYISFQRQGSEVVREGLRSGEAASSVLAALDRAWARASAGGPGTLEAPARSRT